MELSGKNFYLGWKGIIFSLIFLVLTDCATFKTAKTSQNPQIKLTGTRIASISLEKITFIMETDISNPNDFPIKLLGGEYRFFINGVEIHGDKFPHISVLKPHKTKSFDTFVPFYEEKQTNELLDALRDRTAKFKVILDLKFQYPEGRRRIQRMFIRPYKKY